MRVALLRPRAFARALVFAVFVIGAVVGSAAPAVASGPTTLGVSGWQVYSNTNISGNPDPLQIHGDPGEYAAAPAIPAQNDAGWAACGPSSPLRSSPYNGTHPLCPNAATIGMAVGSILSGCWSHLNFTYFQALVSIPAGTTISQFSVNMSGADDGARISLVNSQYPNGVTPSNGYIYQLTPQSTGNLASYVAAGEVNRVVITQVDDCAVGNNLNSAQILLNGTVIPPAPADTTPPTDSPVVSPAANGAGWNNSDVIVNWNWTDSGSGIDSAHCVQSGTSSGEGAITLTSTCRDIAGNSASDSVTVHVDKTAPADSPVVSPAANGAGWNNSDVTVNWNWTDSGSGIDSAHCVQSGTSSGEGAITLTSTCQDIAGNQASDSVTVHVDKTPPVVAYSGNAGTYTVDQSVSISCSASDALSGVASSTCAGVSGPARSFGLGSHTVSATATDNAGNTGTGSTSFTVTVDANSLCALVQQFSTNAGIANSLCVKLQAAAAAAARGQSKTKANDLDAFDNEVTAQSGKALTADQAALLVQFAAAL
ncbi:MAG TPA: HYR domain-containing protein [Gaiellaceae bacterium]